MFIMLLHPEDILAVIFQIASALILEPDDAGGQADSKLIDSWRS